MSTRYIKGSVFVEDYMGNAMIGMTHSQHLRGAGMLRETPSMAEVVIERADCQDLAHCLFVFLAADREKTAGRLGVRIEEDVTP